MADRKPVGQLEEQELHRQVATEVMGWSHISEYTQQGLSGNPPDWDEEHPANKKVPFYTKNIEDAWKVVEALPDHGFVVGVSQEFPDQHGGEIVYGATVGRANREGETVSGNAPSAPVAICRAALRAVRTMEDEETE